MPSRSTVAHEGVHQEPHAEVSHPQSATAEGMESGLRVSGPRYGQLLISPRITPIMVSEANAAQVVDFPGLRKLAEVDDDDKRKPDRRGDQPAGSGNWAGAGPCDDWRNVRLCLF